VDLLARAEERFPRQVGKIQAKIIRIGHCDLLLAGLPAGPARW